MLKLIHDSGTKLAGASASARHAAATGPTSVLRHDVSQARWWSPADPPCVPARQLIARRPPADAAGEQVAVAHLQLEQAKAAHREQNEPYVIVDIQPRDPASGVLVVVVENIGPTVARNVRIAADPPLVSGWGDDLTQMLQRAMSRTIPMLPPGRRLEYLLDNHARFESDLPTAYNFTSFPKGRTDGWRTWSTRWISVRGPRH
ncbi:hypothetical protein OG533_19715 [Streptomyces sp. NBC_01186]|uniref:hypothetical protein n=1 Tax=Streptomyces sp. NBC_01186 TaxID=2903765 RepID=UPI002E0FFE55|nr:hypothetical protein OG533_19715 [Streptomyces sp. NBC_01186]